MTDDQININSNSIDTCTQRANDTRNTVAHAITSLEVNAGMYKRPFQLWENDLKSLLTEY